MIDRLNKSCAQVRHTHTHTERCAGQIIVRADKLALVRSPKVRKVVQLLASSWPIEAAAAAPPKQPRRAKQNSRSTLRANEPRCYLILSCVCPTSERPVAPSPEGGGGAAATNKAPVGQLCVCVWALSQPLIWRNIQMRAHGGRQKDANNGQQVSM